MSAIAGILYLTVVALGSCLLVRGPEVPSSVDLLACRLIAVFALFFFGFDVLGAFGLFFPGRWVTFFNAALVILAVAAIGRVWSLLCPRVPAGHADASTVGPTVRPPGSLRRCWEVALRSWQHFWSLAFHGVSKRMPTIFPVR